MQIAITLISWALLNYWDFHLWYRMARWFRKSWRRRSDFHPHVAERLKQRQDDHRDRLIESVVEFRKSQCYFMIPIQIAAIISIRTGDLKAETLQQVFNNYAFLMILSVGGYLPVTLILFVLRTLGYRSPYTSILSIVSVTLLGIALFMAVSFTHVSDTLRPPPGVRYPGCGNISAVSYCLSGSTDRLFVGATGPVPAFIFSVIILILLCLVDFSIQDIRLFAPMRK